MGALTRRPDGTFYAPGPLVITCGCGSVVPKARRLMTMAGAHDIPMVVSSSNEGVRAYVRQVGLADIVPSLRSSRHSVLFNPLTGKYINLLDVPHNEAVASNIRKVLGR